MTAYLIRRFLQMLLVVLLSTMAIYALLNAAPGGPLSGLKAGSADRRQGVSANDIERLKAYLGIDKPLILRYMTWLLGDDWLGSDWMSISWGGHRDPTTCHADKEAGPLFSLEQDRIAELDRGELSDGLRAIFQEQGQTIAPDARLVVTKAGANWQVVAPTQIYFLTNDPQADRTKKLNVYKETCTYVRFWTNPGVAHLRPQYTVWVQGTVSGEFIAAPNVKVNPAYLFSLAADLTADLDSQQVPAVLRTEFAGRGKILSPESQVSVEQAGSRWTLVDGNSRYIIWRTDQKFAVYNAATALPSGWNEAILVENQGDRIVVQYLQGGQTTLRFPSNVTIDYPVDGPESMEPGDRLWIRVQKVEEIDAVWIKANPRSGEKPDREVITAEVLKVDGATVWAQTTGGTKGYTIHTTADTQFEIPNVISRPEDGTWLNVGWFFNTYGGIFGPYAGFHGNQHGVLRLDWGQSWKIAPGQQVTTLIESRLTNTIILMSAATLFSLLVAVPIGIISAVKQYSVLDYIVTTFTFFGSAMPVFWFGLMLILLFSYKFREWGMPFMPTGGVVSVGRIEPGNVLSYLNTEPGSAVDRIVHLIMPTIVLSLLYMAGWSRFTRSSMLEVLRQDYVRTARAKGLRERVVLSKHALRNALIPLITIVVFQLPGIFGGAIITETIFGYHGMGSLYFAALNTADWPVAMVLLLITSILVVVATLLGDILYTIVDPRIRLE